jgi:hypothetical protein
LNYSLPTVTRILNEADIHSPEEHKKAKIREVHPSRPRKPHAGDMLQMDASIHPWLPIGSKQALHAAIDDATSKVWLVMAEEETYKAYIQLFNKILIDEGIPKLFLTDKRGVFYNLSPTAHIQFERICNNLGVEIITTSNPRSKGRMERLNRTLQSRLVADFRRCNITTIEDANKFLNDYTIEHNEEFTVEPESSISSFTKLPDDFNFNEELSRTTERVLSSGNVISFNSKKYKPVDDNNFEVILDLVGSCTGEVMECLDGTVKYKYNNKTYKLEEFCNTKNQLINKKWRLGCVS